LRHVGNRLSAFGALMLVSACGGGSAGAQGTPGEHPRLMVTPAMVADLRARSGDADVAALIADADRLAASGIDPGYQGIGYADTMPTLGLAYLVTQDAKYAQPALEMLDDLNAKAATGDVSDVAVDSTYASRSTAFALGLAFDWFYPLLGDARKAATVRTANAYWDWYLTGDRVFEKDGPAYSNYFVGHLLGYGAMGHATSGDNPRASEMTTMMRSLFNANVPSSFTTGANAGGFPVEGYVYGANTYVRLFWYMRMVETATGEKIGDAGAWSNEIVRTFIASTKPNLWQQSDEGEYTGDATAILQPNQLAVFTSLADDASTRSHGRWLLENHRQPEESSTGSLLPATNVLFPVADAPVDYRGALPTHRHAAGAAMSFMRSSWDDNAVWASFNASFNRRTGHVGRQTGHFTIQRGADYLLVNAAQWKLHKEISGSTVTGYNGPGYYGNTFVSPSSAWMNTLFADDGPGGYLLDGDSYSGGQAGFSDDWPYVVSQRSDMTYVKVDATHAYHNNFYPDMYDQRAVTQFVRNFAFFAPGNAVVFDRVRVKSTAITYDLRFYFNSNGPPVLAGGVATSTVNGSKLFMRPVLPANVSMRAGWQQLENVNFAPRVELRPASPSTEFDALTVFTAAGTDFPNAPAANAVRSDDQSMVGVQIKEPQLERVALFASAPTDRIAAAVAYTLASTGARHTLYDMQPGMSYGVTATMAGGDVHIAVTPGGATISADEAGVLGFDVAGTTVTPLPQDPAPLVTEPARPAPPLIPGEQPGASGGGGGCSCRTAAPVRDASLLPLLLGLAFLCARRRR
jgi:hypothetical protein